MVGGGCAVGCSTGGFRGSPAPGGEQAPHVATRSFFFFNFFIFIFY